jgi:hypothetical protein
MSPTAIDPIRIEGLDPIPCEVSGNGKFYATYEGARHDAETLAELKRKVVTASRRKRAKVSIPFTTVSTQVQPQHRRHGSQKETVRHGTCSGLHASNSNMLIKWADAAPDARAEQVSAHRDRSVEWLRRLTPAEVVEYEGLLAEWSSLMDRVKAFRDSRKLDVRQAVKEAIAAQDGGGELEEDGE